MYKEEAKGFLGGRVSVLRSCKEVPCGLGLQPGPLKLDFWGLPGLVKGLNAGAEKQAENDKDT